jgi:DNA-binding LytR/AlgR family response regulator
MRIAICDSDIDCINYIIRMLKQIRELENTVVTSYVDSSWLISDVRKREEAFDILIINTRIKGIDGIQLAKNILEYNATCQIIFISDTSELIPECYQVDHVYLLSRGKLPYYLYTAIQKAIQIIGSLDEKYISVTMNKAKILIPCNDILYFERVQRQTIIVLGKQRYTTYQTPSELINQVGQERFIQCHRSFHMNIKKVLGYNKNEFILMNDILIPIGRQFNRKSKEVYSEYCKSSVCL